MKEEGGELSLLQEVIASLPPSRFTFAYGSGALSQRGMYSAAAMELSVCLYVEY